MGRFRYNMQNILSIKEKMEVQEKQQFALQRKRLTEEEEKLAALEAEKERLIEEGKQLRLTRLNILDIKENTAAKQYQDELIRNQEAAVKTAQKNLEIARIRMQKAMQEKEIHEKLKEKAWEEFLVQENRDQAKEIDELTSYVYGKNKTVKP